MAILHKLSDAVNELNALAKDLNTARDMTSPTDQKKVSAYVEIEMKHIANDLLRNESRVANIEFGAEGNTLGDELFQIERNVSHAVDLIDDGDYNTARSLLVDILKAYRQ